MLHRAGRLTIDLKWLVLTAILTISLTILLILTGASKAVKAQESPSNMHTLLTQLHEEDVTILFQFAIPLVADETDWNIPDNSEIDSEVSRVISDIGDDYICFNELAGQAYSIRCTPFSNIVSISYLNMPE